MYINPLIIDSNGLPQTLLILYNNCPVLFGKKKPIKRNVTLIGDVCESILSYAKIRHPNEAILVLKGKSKNGIIRVDGLVVPPFSHSGPTFAGFPYSFLPFDSSYVGMVHTHPSGTAQPSVEDLHNFFGLVSIIVQYPYKKENIYAWSSAGERVKLDIE